MLPAFYRTAETFLQECWRKDDDAASSYVAMKKGNNHGTQIEGRMVGGRLVRNTILQQIPISEFEALCPHLSFAELRLAVTLQREHSKIESACFVSSGIASLVFEAGDGRSVEVGIAGREEMIGLPLIAGLQSHAHMVIMQVSGHGFMIDGNVLQRLLKSLPELRGLLIQRLAIRSLQFAQNAACNRLHNVKQRVARWLLAAHDRIDTDVVQTTHEFLAKLVGTDRPTVSVAMAKLEQSGIRRGRASIHIVQRQSLEREACECYAALRRFNHDLGLETEVRSESDRPGLISQLS
jgi:CRP-like cAMP-binding protein